MAETTRLRKITSAIADRGGSRTLYDVLQVAPHAEQAVLRAAYHALARSKHPDLNSDETATERMRELNEAYDLLKDSRRRTIYDLRLNQRPAERRAGKERERVLRWTTCWRCKAKLDAFSSYCSHCHWLVCEACRGCGCENPAWKPLGVNRAPAWRALLDWVRSTLTRIRPRWRSS